MRILRIDIENFGRLSDVHIELSEGLNVLWKENGWGKTTLAEFIKVIFYGFGNERKRSLLENDRKRYAPWQGGVYGGSISFEEGGRSWRAERVFGEKDGRQDSFVLYDERTNLPSDHFGSNLGEELFGIDRESFCRTAFVGQQDMETSVTPGMSAKIGNLSAEIADMADYEKSQLVLKKEMDRLTPNRKTGEIRRLTDRLAELSDLGERRRRQKEKEDWISDRLEESDRRLLDLEREQKDLQDRMKAVGEWKDVQAEAARYDQMTREAQAVRERIRRIRRDFPLGLPTLEETEDTIEAVDRLLTALASREALDLTEEETMRLRDLEAAFRTAAPSYDEIRQKQTLLLEKREAEKRLRQEALSAEEIRRMDYLEKKLGDLVTEAGRDRIREMTDHAVRLEELREELPTDKDMLSGYKVLRAERLRGESRVRICILAMAAGAALAAAGLILLMLPVRLPVFLGLGGLGLGLLLLLAGALFGNREKAALPKMSMSVEEAGELLRTIRMLEAEREERENLLRVFFDSYHMGYREMQASGILYHLREEAEEAGRLLARQRRESSSEDLDRVREIHASLTAYLAAFGIEAGEGEALETGLQRLTYEMEEYEKLRQKLISGREFEERLSRDREQVRDFLSRYGFLTGEEKAWRGILEEMRTRLFRLAELEEDAAGREALLAGKDFGKTMGRALELQSEVSEVSMEELARLLEEKKEEYKSRLREKNEYIRQERDSGEKLELLDEETEEKKVLEQERDRLLHRFEVIRQTADYLERARAAFSARYMDPIKEAFDYYYRKIAPGDAKVYSLDANLNLSLREAGAARDLGFLSAGYRDLVHLCRRMAFLDAMYEQEKPMLILDDPFVNLDDGKLEGALSLVRELEKRYQILYFVCRREGGRSGMSGQEKGPKEQDGGKA